MRMIWYKLLARAPCRKQINGKEADAALGAAHITVNKNAVPNDPRPPMVTSGIRIGTPAATTRGFKEAEVREVADLIADVLDAEGVPTRTIFHCFTGDEAEARKCVERGAYLSFSGIVTFKSAEDVRRAAQWCPIDHVLLETDAPFLAPIPHRGKPNQPALVPIVGTFIADLRGEPVAQFAQHTTRNACLAFPGIAP